MNHDIDTMVIRMDRELQGARLERTRQVREGMGLRPGMPARLGQLLMRAGARLQGIPQPTLPEVTTRAPEPTHATV